MITIKQENIAMKSELNSEIKSLRKDLNQLQADVATDFSELRNLISTNAQSIDRICNERSNGVANLKSDIKLLKTDVKIFWMNLYFPSALPPLTSVLIKYRLLIKG